MNKVDLTQERKGPSFTCNSPKWLLMLSTWNFPFQIQLKLNLDNQKTQITVLSDSPIAQQIQHHGCYLNI